VDKSTVRPQSLGSNGKNHGGIMCWRCGTEINGGKPVESRKGLRHEECPK
jgi:hypothetical protein